MITLFCWVLGGRRPFPIVIDGNKTVSDLTKAIIARTPWSSSVAQDLQLCLANIPDTRDARNKFVFEDSDLPGSMMLSEVFPGQLPENHIHLIIKEPGK